MSDRIDDCTFGRYGNEYMVYGFTVSRHGLAWPGLAWYGIRICDSASLNTNIYSLTVSIGATGEEPSFRACLYLYQGI